MALAKEGIGVVTDWSFGSHSGGFREEEEEEAETVWLPGGGSGRNNVVSARSNFLVVTID